MTKRIYNFSAGPATLPLPVLEEAQKDFVDYKGAGMSIIEMSHRSKQYDAVHQETKAAVKRLLNISDEYDVLFMTGGASTQFAFIPMNFCTNGKADYVNTGSWSKKAIKEAKIQGKSVNVAASSEDKNFNYIPTSFKFSDDASYVHITANNTIAGTQYKTFPKTKAPLMADMSSDIMSKTFDVDQFGLIYAGAQKNIGPAGVCLVIVKKALLETIPEGLPTMFSYKTHAAEDSLYNTPPVFAIYIMGLVMKWLEANGGIAGMQKKNEEKAKILFDRIDKSDYYKPTVAREHRSLMNVTFRLPSEDLEKKFITEATAAGLSGLKGHRSVGGCRASIYNAFPKEGIVKLVEFMDAFEKAN
ncbi:MAG: 3-phosphoserine/phosphohydroxythreonine transaminase [Candidatus Omnitrophica bacterium]|nr:3-phosphoserine/phosphohydroxythreonine transaminase [Candidatus Omnitrophota bacterium]